MVVVFLVGSCCSICLILVCIFVCIDGFICCVCIRWCELRVSVV